MRPDAQRAGIESDDAEPHPVFRQRPPRFLYRYRSLSGRGHTWAEDIIVNSHFFWPAPTDFNDPFDFAPLVDVPRGAKLRSALLKARARQRVLVGRETADKGYREISSLPRNQVLERMRRAFDETASSTGVLCFSEVPDSVLMWGHYADCHRGTCLRFDPHIPEIEASNLLYQVRYEEERPMVARFLERENSGELAQALTTKAKFWAYEREWRAIENRGANVRRPFSPAFLSGIIFGCRTSQATKDLVGGWVSRRSVPVDILQAVPCAETYAIRLARL